MNFKDAFASVGGYLAFNCLYWLIADCLCVFFTPLLFPFLKSIEFTCDDKMKWNFILLIFALFLLAMVSSLESIFQNRRNFLLNYYILGIVGPLNINNKIHSSRRKFVSVFSGSKLNSMHKCLDSYRDWGTFNMGKISRIQIRWNFICKRKRKFF